MKWSPTATVGTPPVIDRRRLRALTLCAATLSLGPVPARAGSPSVNDLRAGYDLFLHRTCANCHAIRGTPAGGRVGPDLTHFASRLSLGAGVLPNTPENLARWLKDPQAIKPGCGMPNLHLTDAQVRQLVAFLEHLK